MQLFFNFISFQKELAAYPLPSNLSAEPPPLAESKGKPAGMEAQGECLQTSALCSTQGIFWTVNKEVLAGNFEKD